MTNLTYKAVRTAETKDAKKSVQFKLWGTWPINYKWLVCLDSDLGDCKKEIQNDVMFTIQVWNVISGLKWEILINSTNHKCVTLCVQYHVLLWEYVWAHIVWAGNVSLQLGNSSVHWPEKKWSVASRLRKVILPSSLFSHLECCIHLWCL